MSFDLNVMTEAVGAWYLAYPDKDWLCLVWRPHLLAGWTVRSRVRYYDPHDPSPWSGLDRRSWTEAHTVVAMTRDEVIASMRQLVAQLREQWPQPTEIADEVLVEGDGWALAQAMQGRPWVHMKQGEEAQAWGEAFEARRLPSQIQAARRAKEPGRRRRR
jgi:hypothetical protein